MGRRRWPQTPGGGAVGLAAKGAGKRFGPSLTATFESSMRGRGGCLTALRRSSARAVGRRLVADIGPVRLVAAMLAAQRE